MISEKISRVRNPLGCDITKDVRVMSIVRGSKRELILVISIAVNCGRGTVLGRGNLNILK